jgi:histidinol-phosphate aminotransferase
MSTSLPNTPASEYPDDGNTVLLDANENAYGPAIPSAAGLSLHRYPDPFQTDVKQRLCALRNTHAHTAQDLTPANLFAGLGSDEAIDALIRCFCAPGREKILTCPPTYGMYTVTAAVNDVAVEKVPLLPAPGFGIDVAAVTDKLSQDPAIKLVYLCSPGNPTGAVLAKDDVRAILEHPTWNGVVVVDEAYVDFVSDQSSASLAEWVLEWPNLVVMQTLSKAFGLAAIRLGVAFASAPVARLLNNMKAPYNVPGPTLTLAIEALSPTGIEASRAIIAKLGECRARLVAALSDGPIPGIGRLRGGLDSNFLLWEFVDLETGKPSNDVAQAVYDRLAARRGVVVRFRGREHGCTGCLRITVGTEEEVDRLVAALREVLAELKAERDGAAAVVTTTDGDEQKSAEEKQEGEAPKVEAQTEEAQKVEEKEDPVDAA